MINSTQNAPLGKYSIWTLSALIISQHKNGGTSYRGRFTMILFIYSSRGEGEAYIQYKYTLFHICQKLGTVPSDRLPQHASLSPSLSNHSMRMS